MTISGWQRYVVRVSNVPPWPALTDDYRRIVDRLSAVAGMNANHNAQHTGFDAVHVTVLAPDPDAAVEAVVAELLDGFGWPITVNSWDQEWHWCAGLWRGPRPLRERLPSALRKQEA